ncbi:hypothetical protein JCM10213_004630 [Rhodosporidiobolus nylandii]
MSEAIQALLVAFRDDLNAGASSTTFSSYFSADSTSGNTPCCVEHGPAGHFDLPFVGHPFVGQYGIRDYYGQITSVLAGKGSTFEEDDLLVKIKGGGRARAVWTGEAVWSMQKTGKESREAVVWAFDLAKDAEGQWKLDNWEVWADTLSAYLASQP